MKRLDTKSYDCAAGCPVEATLDLIDGKWKAVILYHLLGDTIRFNELGRRLSRITQRMLTRQLRELDCGRDCASDDDWRTGTGHKDRLCDHV
ncbi:DNA-binding HxlR family transcriptional regulator [Bradyrhizobium sp. AZCC 2262]